MKSNRAFTAVAFTAIVLAAGTASARPDYVKPLVDNGDNGAYSYSAQLIADDFVLTSNASIAQATWYGTYDSAFDPFNTGDSVNFTVRFYNLAVDRPELAPFFSQPVTATVTDTGVDSTQGGRRYLFSGSFNPVALVGGTTYYFSVEETDTNTGKPGFRWNNGAVDGDDDNIAFAIGGVGNAWNISQGEPRSATAFTLSIPTPSTAALALAGALLAGRRRR